MRHLLIAGIALLSGFVVAMGSTPDVLETSSPRPLSDLIGQLNAKHATFVSYEDAPIVNPGALIDVTDPAYSGPRRGLKIKSNPIRVEVPATLDWASNETAVDAHRARQRQAIAALLQAYAQSGNLGSFSAEHNGAYSQVFPTTYVNEQGDTEPFDALLNTSVTIPKGSYTLDRFIWMVCSQVSLKRDVPIMHGTAPVGLLMGIVVKSDGRQGRARDLLVNAFEQARGLWYLHGAPTDIRLGWFLLFDPEGKAFFMNIDVARQDRAMSALQRDWVPEASNASRPSDNGRKAAGTQH